MSSVPTDARLRRYRAMLAPGTPLRAGLDRIVLGRTGALVVLGTNRVLEQICTGGIALDEEFSATLLRELAKMDGAVVCTADVSRLARAGTHLMPDPTIPAIETGTRHRTAERVSAQTHLPVVAVSASMGTISLYLEGERHPIDPPAVVLVRANQALQTLQRYQARLIEVLDRLSTLEIQDQVTVRDVITVLQRCEHVRRLGLETESYVADLGSDGRLLGLQLLEVTVDTEHLPGLLAQDYFDADSPGLSPLTDLSDTELVEPLGVARALGLPDTMETRLRPRGHRQLARVPRLPAAVSQRLIDQFGDLQALLGATQADLLDIEGVGAGRARLIRDQLTRAAEAAFSS